MKEIEIYVHYPWAGVTSDRITIEVPNETSESELNDICYEYALDAIFDRGLSWDYKEV